MLRDYPCLPKELCCAWLALVCSHGRYPEQSRCNSKVKFPRFGTPERASATHRAGKTCSGTATSSASHLSPHLLNWNQTFCTETEKHFSLLYTPQQFLSATWSKSSSSFMIAAIKSLMNTKKKKKSILSFPETFSILLWKGRFYFKINGC